VGLLGADLPRRRRPRTEHDLQKPPEYDALKALLLSVAGE
jgi:hypothetical protein